VTHRALFLDRDGVINVDRHYVCTRDEFEFVDGIFELCTKANRLGYLLIVVTNQAGIGRGYYTDEQFRQLTEWMRGAFRDRGAPIVAVYHCPYHPEHGVGAYKMDSSHRKPQPGMILQAAVDFDVDLQRSTLVGDKETDVQAGVAAGVGCNLLYRPNSVSRDADDATAATSIVTRLADVVPFLEAQVNGNPLHPAPIAGHSSCI
jgi:D-glycero-D-manno-heptose 1,7-bisphosphate phosphatase